MTLATKYHNLDKYISDKQKSPETERFCFKSEAFESETSGLIKAELLLTERSVVDGDLPNGYGEMIYQDGHKYVGYWKNGKFNGKGTLTYPADYYPNQPDILVYEGDWEFGFLVNCTNGHVYEGYPVKVNI